MVVAVFSMIFVFGTVLRLKKKSKKGLFSKVNTENDIFFILFAVTRLRKKNYIYIYQILYTFLFMGLFKLKRKKMPMFNC